MAETNLAPNNDATQEEAAEWNDIIETAAGKDQLTQTYNRRGLRHLIRRMIASPNDYLDHDGKTLVGQKLGVLMLDLDHFKKLNGRYGHDVGDKVLSEFAALLKKSVRNTDAILRYGGEEFVAFFFGGKEGVAIETYKKIDKRLKKLPIATGENEEHIKINFSAGLDIKDWDGVEAIADATSARQLNDTVGQVCRGADQALLQAKRKRGMLVVVETS